MKASDAIKVLNRLNPETEVELDIKIIRGRKGIIFSPTTEQLFILVVGIVLIIYSISGVVETYYRNSHKINYITEKSVN
jgi:hypothetical protein